MFAFQALVNETALHRDLGLGDVWRCPLPNGYSILMIDETDHGWVFNPKTQPGPGIVEQDDAVSGIQQLQLSENYVLGNRNDAWGVDSRQNSTKVSYVILDTSTGTHTQFANEKDFQHSAAKLGVTSIRLEPIDVVYRRYRFAWFDMLVGFLFFPPPAGLVGLGLWIMRVRKRGRATQPAITP